MPTFFETTSICVFCLELHLVQIKDFVKVGQSMSILASIFICEEFLLHFAWLFLIAFSMIEDFRQIEGVLLGGKGNQTNYPWILYWYG